MSIWLQVFAPIGLICLAFLVLLFTFGSNARAKAERDQEWLDNVYAWNGIKLGEAPTDRDVLAPGRSFAEFMVAFYRGAVGQEETSRAAQGQP